MTLQERKLHLINQLVHTSDTKFIGQVEDLLKKSFREKYEKNLKPMSVKELLERINAAEEDVKYGRVYTQKEVESYFKNKRKK